MIWLALYLYIMGALLYVAAVTEGSSLPRLDIVSLLWPVIVQVSIVIAFIKR